MLSIYLPMYVYVHIQVLYYDVCMQYIHTYFMRGNAVSTWSKCTVLSMDSQNEGGGGLKAKLQYTHRGHYSECSHKYAVYSSAQN